MRRHVLLLGLAVAGGLVAAPSAWAVAGTDLLEPDAGTETAATAQPVALGPVIEQQVVLGPASVRDEDFFVARGTAGALVTVRLQHRGEVDARPLALGLPRTAGGAIRWRRARNGQTIVAQARIAADGRLLLQVRCGAAAAACAAPGAIPYRLRVISGAAGSGTAATRGVRRRAARTPVVKRGRLAPARDPKPTPSKATAAKPAPTRPTATTQPSVAPADPDSGGVTPSAPAPAAASPDSGGTPLPGA